MHTELTLPILPIHKAGLISSLKPFVLFCFFLPVIPHVQYVHMRQCDYTCNRFMDSDAHLLPPIPQCTTRRSEVTVMAHTGIPATLCVMMATVHSCLPAASSQSHNRPQLLLGQPQAHPPFKAVATLGRSSWFHLKKPKPINTFI